ncbi:hypothetical protein NM208_g3939 [Fusarium decemcellulare]|uniref:Uncharacterized protein n=1 Tax=Fusarium decemcellulare TaxID=57161 RepID=A0ACC1SMJ9_9HYPO|nr:hypothetical protein NM208_g3939 [Fusarium decemcellulare]
MRAIISQPGGNATIYRDQFPLPTTLLDHEISYLRSNTKQLFIIHMNTALCNSPSPPYCSIDLVEWQRCMHRRIDEWLLNTPKENLSVAEKSVTDTFQLTYHTALFYLYRPSPNIPNSSDSQSVAMLTIYWHAVENLSSAGIALLYGYAQSAQVRHSIPFQSIESLAQTCSSVLWGMVEHFPAFQGKRDAFDIVASEVLADLKANRTSFTGELPRFGEHSNSQLEMDDSHLNLQEGLLPMGDSVSACNQPSQFPVTHDGLDENFGSFPFPDLEEMPLVWEAVTDANLAFTPGDYLKLFDLTLQQSKEPMSSHNNQLAQNQDQQLSLRHYTLIAPESTNTLLFVQRTLLMQAVTADDFDDGDSAISSVRSSGSSSVTSLRSSVLRFQEENGRTYHALSSGKYSFPNDEDENNRLDLQHNLWLLTLRGELGLCPKIQGPVRRVLDAGTGTGIWAIEYADIHPEAEVIGVDLSPIQPSLVPPNCNFELDDLEKDWTWSSPFDFIFARVMTGCFTDMQAFVHKAYENLEPGGYLEMQDLTHPFGCDDGTLPEDIELTRFGQLCIEASANAHRPIDIAPKYKDFLEKAGFIDVVERQFKWPLNRWPKDKHYKELGKWSYINLDTGLEGLALGLFTRFLDWTPDEVRIFCAAMRKQLQDPRIHAYIPIYVVYGRKPGDQATSAVA